MRPWLEVIRLMAAGWMKRSSDDVEAEADVDVAARGVLLRAVFRELYSVAVSSAFECLVACFDDVVGGFQRVVRGQFVSSAEGAPRTTGLALGFEL